MKTRLAALACLAIAFAACSGGEGPSADQPTSTAPAVEETPAGEPSPTAEPTVVATVSGLVPDGETMPDPATSEVPGPAIEDCLDVRSEPNFDADIVDCVSKWVAVGAEPGGVWTPEPSYSSLSGTFWRRLEWNGREVWIDNRFLERYSISSRSFEFWGMPQPPREFPDNLALVGFATIFEDCGHVPLIVSTELIRIRRGSEGDLVRETLFTPPEAADLGWRYIYGVIATPHLSRIVFATGEALYESVDGGVSWSHLDDLEMVLPRFDLRFVPGDDDGDPDQILSIVRASPYSDDDTILTLHPSGEKEIVPTGEPWWMSRLGQMARTREDYRSIELLYPDDIAAPDEFYPRARVSEGQLEGKLIGSAWFLQPALTRSGATESDVDWNSIPLKSDVVPFSRVVPLVNWPTIYDTGSGLIQALALPGVWYFEEEFSPFVGLQYGPFLQVSGVDDCLPIRAEASADGEELACATERVLLTDLAETSEMDGATWHRVRTPAGIEGWADGRYLE